MDILTWNCRGAGSDEFHRLLAEMLQQYNPTILVLLETRVKGSWSHHIMQYSRLNRCLLSEARGYAGGIWLFWDDNILYLAPLSCNEQLLTVAMKIGDMVNWIFSPIYTSPNVVYREVLWSYIQKLNDCVFLG